MMAIVDETVIVWMARSDGDSEKRYTRDGSGKKR